MSCFLAHDPQLARLADAIAQRVGPQRFHVWFNNSTRLDLKHDGLEIAVPNDFISEWIVTHFTRPIQEAAHEVLGCSLPVRFNVMPQLFEMRGKVADGSPADTRPADAHPPTMTVPILADTPRPVTPRRQAGGFSPRPRLRHDLSNFIVGSSNELAFNAVAHVAEYPGSQYNPLFIHGHCGLGKTHLLQGLCRRFIQHNPTQRWMYMTGEEFTNEYLSAMRGNRLDTFRRKMRDLDLLVIDDVHFLSGKKATQEEFLHTFNAIEAMGRQVVMASDNHPKLIEEFGESLINRFVSGMVVRIDPPNCAMRSEILRGLAAKGSLRLDDAVIQWIARRVTQNVRELEGAVARIAMQAQVTGRPADLAMARDALGDLDRQLVAPLKSENILQAVCVYFGIENKDLMSGRRQRTVSLARSVAMYLIRKTAKLSFPEIGSRLGKRNHSTVISACRRIEKAIEKHEVLAWSSAVGDRQEEADELIQRLEEHARAIKE